MRLYRDGAVSDETGSFHALAGLPSGSIQWSHGALFVKTDAGIERCTTEPVACRTVIAGRLGFAWAVSPDGSQLSVDSDNGREAWIVDVATGARHPTPAREAVWLDASRLVYMTESQLWMWDERSGAIAQLGAPAPFPEQRMLVASPDGHWIAAVGRRIERRPAGIQLSHDGFVMFDVAHRTWGPWHGTGADDRGMLSSGIRDPRWSPSSQRAVYLDETEVMMIDARGPIRRGNLNDEATPRAVHHAAELLGWLDDRRVAYLKLASADDSEIRRFGHGMVHTTCNLVVLDVDTGRELAITDNASFVECHALFERR
jgi:hypothetical protein